MLTVTLMLLLWTLSASKVKLKMPLSATITMLSFFITTFSLNKSITLSSECSPLHSLSTLSFCMTILSMWVTAMMMLASTKYFYKDTNPKMFSTISSILLMMILMFFMTDDFLTLYVLFEASLLPTLVLVVRWGYQPERLKAVYYFLIYAITASLPLLTMILSLKFNSFSTSMFHSLPMFTPEFKESTSLKYLALVMAFMVKAPTWGVHLWLPKAHVEAPISGSMILAGILLKLGGYGLIQITKSTFKICTNMKFMMFSINLWGAFIVGLVCLASVDMKELIAYSSVIHMNMMVLGVLSNSMLGIHGAIMMMIAHGISSPGMFALANMNYKHTKTRNLMLQKGILSTQPKLAMLWFILVAVNMAAPPSLNLASEILIYSSVLKISFSIFILGIFSMVLSGAYNLYLFSSQLGQVSKSTSPSINLTTKNISMGLFHCIPPFLSILIFYLMM